MDSAQTGSSASLPSQAGRPGRRALPRAVGLLALALAALLSACGDSPGPAPKVAPRAWTAEEMSKDPEGYLAWADTQLAEQKTKREQFLGTLAQRQTKVRERQQKAGADLGELENFLQRLTTAVRRADDEDRWPAKVGGRSYERSQALELMETLPKQIELRRPLSEEYDKAIAAMDAKAASMRAEVQQLDRLRQKLALDLERVRLSQGSAELKTLGATAEDIARYAKVLADVMAEAPAEDGPGGPRGLAAAHGPPAQVTGSRAPQGLRACAARRRRRR